MGRRLDEDLGSVGFDNLIAGMYPPAEVFYVELTAGQGVLRRGTLLALKDGTMEMISTATTGKANAVLAELVDTGTGEGDAKGRDETVDEKEDAREAVETVSGIAYRTGHFNTNSLIVAEDYEITSTDKEALRTAGILLSDAVER
ncbi:head decoration protein [bacterium D16-54]|nr:head decoration protein [bacterium D16-54]RKJ09343.1 head decoration protein [bacterium D16-56]